MMSMAQKTWPREGRIRMSTIHGTDASSSAALNGPLTGKVSLVTGGNRGIGKAIALRLAALGASIAIFGPDLPTLEYTANEIRPTRVRVHSQRADGTKSSH